MEVTGLVVLKHLSWVLTVGTAFIGSWFFDFTSTDPVTQRKTITKPGRIGLAFTFLALVFSLALTIWTDIDAAEKQAKSDSSAASQREAAREAQIKSDEYQRKSAESFSRSERAIADLTTILATIDPKKLDAPERAALQKAVVSLKGLEDYQKHYPELYVKLMQATTLAEFRSLYEDGSIQAVLSRISDKPECSIVPRPVKKLGESYPYGNFSLREDGAALGFMITDKDVRIKFVDATETNKQAGGYQLIFTDGSESPQLKCTLSRTAIWCDDSTLDPTALSVFKQIQEKELQSVRRGSKTFTVPKEVAAKVRTTFACIAA